MAGKSVAKARAAQHFDGDDPISDRVDGQSAFELDRPAASHPEPAGVEALERVEAGAVGVVAVAALDDPKLRYRRRQAPLGEQAEAGLQVVGEIGVDLGQPRGCLRTGSASTEGMPLQRHCPQ